MPSSRQLLNLRFNIVNDFTPEEEAQVREEPVNSKNTLSLGLEFCRQQENRWCEDA